MNGPKSNDAASAALGIVAEIGAREFRPQGARISAHRIAGADPSIDAMREAIPDGLRVAVALAAEAAAAPSPANLDALLSQLYGVQMIALRLRRIVGQDAR
jgi:hypothetical protein